MPEEQLPLPEEVEGRPEDDVAAWAWEAARAHARVVEREAAKHEDLMLRWDEREKAELEEAQAWWTLHPEEAAAATERERAGRELSNEELAEWREWWGSAAVAADERRARLERERVAREQRGAWLEAHPEEAEAQAERQRLARARWERAQGPVSVFGLLCGPGFR